MTKSKRWKRRNRHTRPEWVEAYFLSDFCNRKAWKGYTKGILAELIYYFPFADRRYKATGLPNFRGELKLK